MKTLKFPDVQIRYLNVKNLNLNNAEHPEKHELEEGNNQGVLKQSKADNQMIKMEI